jgi:pimeloyl-ACP methyl ester carboxylesterase
MIERVVGGLAVREWGDPGERGILLWPGLGATAAYFDPIAELLPARAFAVDPPGFGGSPALDRSTRQRYADAAREIIESTGCSVMIGHSLGAYVALDVAADPPGSLRQVVLIDGGFLGAREFREFGMPLGEGREVLIAWLEANAPRFADWETATTTLAVMLGADPSPVIATYVRQIFAEVGGEIRGIAGASVQADALLATLTDETAPPATDVQVPTLLIACGLPSEHRVLRQAAWERLVESSPLVRLHVEDAWNHNPVLQEPDGISALIAHWLEKA